DGSDAARCDTAYADAVPGPFRRPDHGHGGDAGLGGGVVGLPHVAGPGDRGNVDDQALALQLDHLGGDLAGAQEDPGQVDVDHRLPLIQRHFLDLAVPHLEQQAIAQDAGVVDQAVDGAEVAGDLADHVAHLIQIGRAHV